MTSCLVVRMGEDLVGRLWLDQNKHFCFQYDQNWLQRARIPLSLSLPLRADPFLDDRSHPFFANLLPEQKIREVVARKLRVSPGNDFGLLERIGGDCAGAVSLYPDDGASQPDAGSYRELSSDQLLTLIKSLPQRPLLAGEQGMRLSLAGAQKKLPVFYEDGRFYLGYGSSPSNHIIKPAIEDLDGTVENEAFCMALARELGLDVPPSFIYQHEGTMVFVVKRFDREVVAGQTKRLHQEDFCQALQVLPEYKYEAEGGPSLEACFGLVRKASARSGKDVMSLLNWTIFNYLIGNSDAHGKNISLLLVPGGPLLAPFYDLLSTRIYAHYGVAQSLAMKIGGESEPDAIRRKHWEGFAAEIGIKPGLVLSKVAEHAGQIHGAALRLIKGEFAPYSCDALYRLLQSIADHSEKAVRRLGH